MEPENSQPTELINGAGDFNESGFEDFLRGAAASIPVIAIVGPQSSGKSALLNHLFCTKFRVMNAQTGRSKTTNGIWIAKAPHIEPTVVLDLEGTDGNEKGEDDTAFEKQSALFAIAIAHTVIINMWCNDVGREHAASRPLLRTVFEAMLSLSLISREKTTLHFVVRDGNSKTGTPSELLKRDLKKDIEEIWKAAPKPQGNEDTLLTDIFNVEVTVLSNYEFMREKFDEEVVQLQKQLISHNLDPSTSKIYLSSAKNTWDGIKKYKGFEVQPFRLMVAKTKCDEIAMNKLKLFESNQAWSKLKKSAETELVKDFGAKTNSILATYLSEYDKETINFESSTNGRYDQQVRDARSSKRQDLKSKALNVVYPAYMNTLGHIRSETLLSFTTQLKAWRQDASMSILEAYERCYGSCLEEFDELCSDYATIELANWVDDASTVREQLLREIKEHALNQLRDELSVSHNTKEVNNIRFVQTSIVQPSMTRSRKLSLPKWAKSIRKWAIFGMSVLGVTGLTTLLTCHSAYAAPLAVALAIARGLIELLPDGRYMYSATKEELKMSDDIPHKHPMLMVSMHEALNTTYQSLITAQKLLNSAAPVVA
ncbi:protein ROOT HAIR DEFECTIVE 3 2-like [Salvia divinorum]|uniref:Protein ROOT HAIR DEFECTIVE 3 2-like n=1 Tax=Salvia divinorum TaxID=28513 RepID=A0ABD1G5J3_SALDI